MRRRLLTLLPAIWLVALLSAPALAYVVGNRQPLLENRAKEPFPPINRSSVRSPEVFAKIDRAVLDRLPLRGDALNLKATVALRWFGVSPSLEVVAGSGGWLYMSRDFRPCQPNEDVADQVAEAAEIVARTSGASGRRVGVLVAGSKTAAQPEHLRIEPDRVLARCLAKREEIVHARLRSTPGGLDITPGIRQELAAGRDVFLKRDSHWEGNAQLQFVRALLDAAEPGLSTKVGLEQVKKPIRREADLTNMIGMPADQDTRPPIARRPVQYPQARPNETLLIGDSQMRLAMTDALEGRPPISNAALPGASYCERTQFNAGACDGQLAASRIVLLEWVARDMRELLDACTHFPSVLLPDLRKRLAAKPAGLVDVASGRRLGKRVTLGSAPSAVRFAPADGDVANSLRLMVVPVERVGPPQPGGPEFVTAAQQPADGLPVASCGTPAAGAGSSIVLPVPAGRDASKLGLELTAPPGTVLGQPQSFVLDDAAVERGMQAALKR